MSQAEVVDVEEIKARVKKLSSQAVKAKMDLHDLAEDLPIGWDSILSVATRTYEIYKELEQLRGQLKSAGV